MLKSRIENDSLLGRSLVTTVPVEKGEVVVEELPFAYGPKQHSPIVCLGCYRYLEGFGEDGDSLERCELCDWPLCSDCSKGSADHRGECDIFAKARVTFAGNVGEDGICTQLDCITPLRVLLAKEANPERWEREVAPMEHHEQKRRENFEVWHADRVNIAQYLRGPCKLAERFSEELIMQVVGILEVNAFEARTQKGYPLRCLYPITGILAHQCVPNTARSIYPSEGYKIRLRAMCHLKADEQLHHSYTYTLDGTAARQAHLKAGKFFTCTCARCKDPTELGTHYSTFKCSKCENGWLLAVDPLDEHTAWKCNLCQFETTSKAVHKAIGVIQAECDAVQAMETSAARLETTEQLLRKYRGVVHPLHYINTHLRQQLIEMYGRVEGYEMAQLPDILLERKEELCRQVLRVLDIFEPGLSRARALILYELHVPLVLLAKSAFIAGTLTGLQLKNQLQEAIEILKECVDILQHEDANTEEGTLCQVARTAYEQLGESVEGLENAAQEESTEVTNEIDTHDDSSEETNENEELNDQQD